MISVPSPGVEAAVGVSSFAKSLFLGELHEDVVFPYPQPDADEQEKIRGLVGSVRELAKTIDPHAMEDAGWVPDELIERMSEEGMTGLEVDHPDHSPEQRAYYRSLAERLDLVATGASDSACS